jgi:hypothetical protein
MTDHAWLAIALSYAALSTAGTVWLAPRARALGAKHRAARRRVSEADRSGGEKGAGR